MFGGNIIGDMSYKSFLGSSYDVRDNISMVFSCASGRSSGCRSEFLMRCTEVSPEVDPRLDIPYLPVSFANGEVETVQCYV